MVNPLDYDMAVPAEELSKYCPGGYHPIRLNDTLYDGRYEILHKLGFGSFSTVWLARDNRDQRNVTVKIVTAQKSDDTSRELRILQALRERGEASHPGWKHVSHLLDWFHHDGPNGRHVCLVLDILGPSVSAVADRCQNYRLDGRLARSVSLQLLQAVDYLHASGVVHADIHMGNVLFRLTELDALSPESAVEYLGPPQVGNVARRDGAPIEPGVPEYLVQPVEYSAKINPDLREVQLVDFGESFFAADPPGQICTPMSLHPPELVFGHSLSNAVDIWNLGCTTYELVIGRTPFEADFDHDRALIPQFEKVIGRLPDGWAQDALNSGVLKEPPDESSAEGFLSLEEELQRSYFEGYDSETLQLSEKDMGVLSRYLRRLLVLDPEGREAAPELLQDPWVLEGEGRKAEGVKGEGSKTEGKERKEG